MSGTTKLLIIEFLRPFLRITFWGLCCYCIFSYSFVPLFSNLQILGSRTHQDFEQRDNQAPAHAPRSFF